MITVHLHVIFRCALHVVRKPIGLLTHATGCQALGAACHALSLITVYGACPFLLGLCKNVYEHTDNDTQAKVNAELRAR